MEVAGIGCLHKVAPHRGRVAKSKVSLCPEAVVVTELRWKDFVKKNGLDLNAGHPAVADHSSWVQGGAVEAYGFPGLWLRVFRASGFDSYPP